VRISISRFLLLFGFASCLGIGATMAIQYYALQTVKVDGPEYQKIIDGKDLVADILPPPLYIIEAYMLAQEGAFDPNRTEENALKLKKLKQAFDDRRAYWTRSELVGDLKTTLLEDVTVKADVFWAIIEKKYLPAAAKHNTIMLKVLLAKLKVAYHQHGQAADTLVQLATAKIAIDEQAAAREVKFLSMASLAAGLVCILAFVGGLYLVRRRTIVPLESMKVYMGNLAAGDYTRDVPYAARQDEIGAMSNAVAVFRQNAMEREHQQRDIDARKSDEIARQMREMQEKADEDGQRQELITQLTEGLEQLSRGNLAFRITHPFSEDYERLRFAFNDSLADLAGSMGTIAATTTTIRKGASSIERATNDLAKRTEQQAATIEQSVASLAQMNTMAQQATASAGHAKDVMASTRADVEQSAAIMGEAIGAMERITGSSSQIGQIINVIDEIAFQTNLLALNAGVEAARAGEAGRGFAVVAQEVRELASRSANAAKEIKTLISASSTQVSSGVSLVNRGGAALGDIAGRVGKVTELIGNIADSVAAQAKAIGEINSAVVQLDAVTQQNATMAEDTNRDCQTLDGDAGSLGQIVGRFEIGGTPAAQGISMQDKPAQASNRPRSKPAPVAQQASQRAVASPARALAATLATAFTAPKAAKDAGSNWEEF